jgi:cytochrome c55X
MGNPRAYVAALAIILAASAAGAAGEPSPERQAELLHRLKHDCGSCHGLTMKGGLGPSLLPARLAERPRDDLVAAILDGVPATPMPPWRSELTAAEAKWLVEVLQEGVPQ